MLKLITGIFYTLLILIIPAMAVGWVSNIVQIINIDNLELTTIVIVKFIGIIMVPLGAVMGVIGWF
jgi:hypothetical protein